MGREESRGVWEARTQSSASPPGNRAAEPRTEAACGPWLPSRDPCLAAPPGKLPHPHTRPMYAEGSPKSSMRAGLSGRGGVAWGGVRTHTSTACRHGSPQTGCVAVGSWRHPGMRLKGRGPQRRAQWRLDRRLEEVAKAVGGGYCRLQMPLRLALGVRGTVAGHRRPTHSPPTPAGRPPGTESASTAPTNPHASCRPRPPSSAAAPSFCTRPPSQT